MKLFQRYVPSVEDAKREREDRARRMGQDLLVCAIVMAIMCIGVLCKSPTEGAYLHNPQLRSFDIVFSCIGFVWVAAVVLFYFLIKPGTRKKLICMYILDAFFVLWLFSSFILKNLIAYPGLGPSVGDIVLYILTFCTLMTLPAEHMIRYRKGKVLLD